MARNREAKWDARPPRYKRGAEDAGRPRGTWYIWRVPPEFAHRTRPEHLRLNGRRFRWDDPPVVNRKTGARGHPGHDGQCRCTAEPVEGE